jgi:hypothetical protein
MMRRFGFVDLAENTALGVYDLLSELEKLLVHFVLHPFYVGGQFVGIRSEDGNGAFGRG